MNSLVDLLEGFWSWQTPLSFLGGVGTHHLYCKYHRDRKGPRPMMFTRKRGSDGEYRLTNRFWVVVAIATVLIGFIGWRTQDTADKVQDQAAYNTAVAEQTNHCLNEVIETLKERVGFNDIISDLRAKRDDVYMNFFTALAAIPTDIPQAERDARAKPIVEKFFRDNAALDKARADALAARQETPYPPENCGAVKPQR